jgi:predicted protein tyrosine phosphatase
MLKCYNISSFEAEKIIVLPTNTALISINDEYSPERKFPFPGHIFITKFSDLADKKVLENLSFNPISLKQAREMLEFIIENKDKNFIVHCFAGVSRSAAVCLFLNLIFGHQLKDNFWLLSCPNPYVLGKLITVYKENYEHSIS